LEDFTALINDLHFNHNLPTVIYTHGFKETKDSESVQAVKDAYLHRGGYNFIVLDWSAYSSGLYFATVVPNLKKTGKAASVNLKKFLDFGYPVQMVHLIGHSLGGQLVGLIGRSLKTDSLNRYEVARITALDPAGPDFTFPLLGSFHSISADDA